MLSQRIRKRYYKTFGTSLERKKERERIRIRKREERRENQREKEKEREKERESDIYYLMKNYIGYKNLLKLFEKIIQFWKIAKI